MGRSFRSCLAVLLGLGLISFCNIAEAGVPDPSLSTVPNVIVSPDGGMNYTVNVLGVGGPIDSSLVQIIFSAECQGLVCWCVGQTYLPDISGYTDVNGDAVFNIAAGGCIDPALIAGSYCVRVFADGVLLDEVGVVSPDVVDGAGAKTTDVGGWNPAGTCIVQGNDASVFTPHFVNNTYDYCSDINSDLLVNAVDASLVTPAIIANASCTAQ